MNQLVARLNPYDPKRGNVMRVFVVGHRRFDAGVWAPVSAELGEVLCAVRQSYYDERSPLAFYVCTQDEATQLGFKYPRLAVTAPAPSAPPPAEGEDTSKGKEQVAPQDGSSTGRNIKKREG